VACRQPKPSISFGFSQPVLSGPFLIFYPTSYNVGVIFLFPFEEFIHYTNVIFFLTLLKDI